MQLPVPQVLLPPELPALPGAAGVGIARTGGYQDESTARSSLERLGDLAVAVGIQNLVAPAYCSLFGLDFILRCSQRFVVDLRIDPTHCRSRSIR